MALKIAIIGIFGVFIGLSILCIFLIIIQKISNYIITIKSKPKTPPIQINNKQQTSSQKAISGEILAAVAVSIYLDFQTLNEKKKLLTIQKVTKPYSPWVNSGKVQIISDTNKVHRR